MNVLFFSHYTDLYGANRSLLNLIDGLKNNSVNCHVIIPQKGEITKYLKYRNIPFAIIPFECWIDWPKRSNNPLKKFYWKLRRLSINFQLIPQITKIIDQWNIEIIYSNSTVLNIGFLLSQILKIPHIWHLREFVDLDYNFSFDWGKEIVRYCLKNSTATIAISQAIYAHYFTTKSNPSIFVIYNGVAFQSQFDQFYELSFPYPFAQTEIYTFSLVGKICPQKGQEIAIKAIAILAKKHQNIRLIIVGSGEKSYENYLQKLTHQLEITDKVEFWGYLDDPFKAYFASDAVLMSSTHEGMGRVTAEAMATGRPVIGYDNAGTSELIENEFTGLLYQNNEPETLAVCMKRFVENVSWSQELGKNGWTIAKQKYSIENYVQQVYQVLSSLSSKS
ncbi:glycosyltransferase [Crocosphaera sp.]|uniref:glycosyltransferase n=1 Tax=Crocosphaera sp. TaxID=2729996 RepID=UPI003F207C68|nr:glycosyltransferase [Crocosphaera sp.]